jgi:phage shock protein A
MATPIQFIIDQEGHKKSVIVPYKQWEELNQRYEKLHNKVKILTGIQDAMKEIEQARKTGKKLQTLTDFLSESRD